MLHVGDRKFFSEIKVTDHKMQCQQWRAFNGMKGMTHSPKQSTENPFYI